MPFAVPILGIELFANGTSFALGCSQLWRSLAPSSWQWQYSRMPRIGGLAFGVLGLLVVSGACSDDTHTQYCCGLELTVPDGETVLCNCATGGSGGDEETNVAGAAGATGVAGAAGTAGAGGATDMAGTTGTAGAAP